MSTLSSANFTEGNILLKEHTQTTNNKIKLHILRVPMNKIGNWLIHPVITLTITDKMFTKRDNVNK